MLEIRLKCERCAVPLPAESLDAMICSFECTFCRACTENELFGKCPNCGGGLEKRPVRPTDLLLKYPPKR
ncbi:MAG: DUF1272 domain-containing protein [Saprospiraceae bacterium]|nr:DUF1272 domain-containing protein [Saprospiraceae bacterium]MBL0083004.1 DUF1272 domain-containing protein [Saprospiraceae bacterium]